MELQLLLLVKEGAAEAMPSTSANKSKLDFDINQLTEEKRIRQEAIFDLASPTITQNHLKNKETDAEPKFKEINEDPCYSPRSRFPMTKESIEEKFSEYYFTAADSIDPIFTIHPVFKKGKKMFKGFTKKHNVANEDSKLPKSGQKHKIRITDSIGRVIFAVNAAGVCLPVSTILDDNIGVEKKENNKTNQKGRASGKQIKY